MLESFVIIIKKFSDNNCDLITDYLWDNVIHNLMMITIWYNNCSQNSWQKYYQLLTENYIRALKTSNDSIKAKNLFPLVGVFNELLFSTRNSRYTVIMNARLTFLFTVTNSDDQYETLHRTVELQKSDEKRKNQFQRVLERNVGNIMIFKLLLKIIISGHIKPYEPMPLEDRLRDIVLLFSGLSVDKLLEILVKCFTIYANNFQNFKDSYITDNRVVKYIIKDLSLIEDYFVEIMPIFMKYKPILNKLFIIESHLNVWFNENKENLLSKEVVVKSSSSGKRKKKLKTYSKYNKKVKIENHCTN
ncbi:uncharacterized protein LOC128953921 [Oppia nitens]|uniref:uncharacterized protein LOC128953921 n=1 Tax=Oppia nitens TaxID=1686743 RepID=UPI0023DCD841|nr:uncharacterized protein LOC128953921 [Oppia nitens]